MTPFQFAQCVPPNAPGLARPSRVERSRRTLGDARDHAARPDAAQGVEQGLVTDAINGVVDAMFDCRLSIADCRLRLGLRAHRANDAGAHRFCPLYEDQSRSARGSMYEYGIASFQGIDLGQP